MVPDPASRAQSDDVHGSSIVVDQSYPWKNPEWGGRPWSETIIYELHPGVFGGFSGIKEQLPRLAALGVTAIELMPIADFPGKFNWGYDGVLPYAPDTSYGTLIELKNLIDTAHGQKLQVFLDVVYNHFGPDGNYLNSYASDFFRSDIRTPWGDSIDFRRPQVRRFFIENALYWINECRFDGLRFDAVHAIMDDTFLFELAAEIRARTVGRHIHLILENEHNDAFLLDATPANQKFDAQWTDDWHHCLHALLTSESEGYYADFQKPAQQLARCLEQGFAYQGEPSAHADGAPRGTASAHLPTTAFVICLQNHDQVGNRAMGDRLTTLAKPAALRAATSLLLLTPQIPMLFMGEEWGETNPFLFFTDHHDELADAVRDGRRQEFKKFKAFIDPKMREKIPDPNDPATFIKSIAMPPRNPTAAQTSILELHKQLIEVRTTLIVPHLAGATSLGAIALNETGVRAAWRLGSGKTLTIAANFGADEIACLYGPGKLIFRSVDACNAPDKLPAYATFAWLET
jgi:maltooligosyltrehalose trehalohydrolase